MDSVLHELFVRMGRGEVVNLFHIILEKYKESKQSTPLHHAVCHGDLNAVQLLVESGADINASAFFRTPLLLACGSSQDYCSEPCCASLCLDEACLSGTPLTNPGYNQAIAEYLIENGADINICDFDNRSPLDLSCKAGNFEMVKLLIDRSANITESCHSTLHYAVKAGNPRIVQLIVDQHLNPDRIISFSETYVSPIMTAVKIHLNNPNVCQIVGILLRAGVDVNREDTDESVLHYCCKETDSPLELLKLLLNYKANINAVDLNGKTPFSYELDRFLDPSKLRNFILPDCEKIETILHHICNMIKNNQFIHPINMKLLRQYLRTKSELYYMKRPISKLNGLSIFNVITKHIDIAGRILENESIADILPSLVKKLPFYGNSLNNVCSEIRARRLVFVSACDVFTKHISSYKLPLELVEKCCIHLTTIELQNLSDVV